MMSKLHRFLLALLVSGVLLAPAVARATTSDASRLRSMSLDELMQIRVTTPNLEAERAAESAAIVTVITGAQLRSWGVRSLYEALGFLPGIVVAETFMGYSVPSFRGIVPGAYNNKVLFLVDGHPSYERLFGSGHLEFVPLESVERIEVVRSPASALYGTQAIAGVVNVITTQDAARRAHASVSGGSFGAWSAAGGVHGGNVVVHASRRRDDGYHFTGTLDEAGQPVDLRYFQELDNALVRAKASHLELEVGFFHQRHQKFGLVPVVAKNGPSEQTGLMFDAALHGNFRGIDLRFTQRYDRMHKELEARDFPTTDITAVNTVQRHASEIRAHAVLGPRVDARIGLGFERDLSDPFVFEQVDGGLSPASPYRDEQDFTNLAAFTQFDVRFDPRWTGVLGARMESNSDNGGSGLVPRVGLVFAVRETTFLKLLYSEAFRAPVFLEKYADVPNTLAGDPELRRESIATWELGLDTRLGARHHVQLTLFTLALEEEITRQSSGNGGAAYVNGPTVETRGVELQWIAELHRGVSLQWNGSYVDGDNGPGDRFVDVPHLAWNAMLNAPAGRFAFSLTHQYVGKRDFVLNDASSTTGSLDAYSLLNAVVSWTTGPHGLDLMAKNLLDADYVHTEPTRRMVATLPGGPGRALYAAYHFSFGP